MEKLEAAANRLVNLKIVTYLGSVEVTGEVDNLHVTLGDDDKLDGVAFVTNVNLLDSDITTIIPDGDIERYADVLAFHREQVDGAMTSMERKAALLVSVVKDVMPVIDERISSPPGQPPDD